MASEARASEHAGVEHGSLNLVTFRTPDELRKLLYKLDCTVDARGVVHGKDSRVAECSSCSSELILDHVGHVLPGSQYFYCDDPLCIVDYLDRFS